MRSFVVALVTVIAFVATGCQSPPAVDAKIRFDGVYTDGKMGWLRFYEDGTAVYGVFTGGLEPQKLESLGRKGGLALSYSIKGNTLTTVLGEESAGNYKVVSPTKLERAGRKGDLTWTDHYEFLAVEFESEGG